MLSVVKSESRDYTRHWLETPTLSYRAPMILNELSSNFIAKILRPKKYISLIKCFDQP